MRRSSGISALRPLCRHKPSGVKMKTFSIIELVKTTKGNSRQIVQEFGEHYERPARARYEELARLYPETYFELMMVETKEECLAFTKGRA